MGFISANAGTIIVLAIVCALVFLAFRSIWKDKKNGRHSCGGNCGACGACSGCSGMPGVGGKPGIGGKP